MPAPMFYKTRCFEIYNYKNAGKQHLKLAQNINASKCALHSTKKYQTLCNNIFSV